MRFASPHRGLVDPAYDGLELPTTSTTMRDNHDGLVPGGLLEHMVLIPHVLSVRAYWSWVRFFTRRGYVHGDIRHPRKGDTCFVFDYDWRRDLVESARALKEFRALLESPGDGTVTRESLLGRTVSDRSDLPAFSGASTIWACVSHNKIQRDSRRSSWTASSGLVRTYQMAALARGIGWLIVIVRPCDKSATV